MKVIELSDRILFSDDIIEIYKDEFRNYVKTKNGDYRINDEDYNKLQNHLLSLNEEDTPISKLYVNNELQYDLTPKEDKKIEKIGLPVPGLSPQLIFLATKINELIEKANGE